MKYSKYLWLWIPVVYSFLLSSFPGLASDTTLGVDFEQNHFFDKPLFSFIYDGRKLDELLPNWKQERISHKLDKNRTEERVVWTDPVTGLRASCVGIKYNDFQAVEWTVYLENTGRENTPIIEKIEAIAASFQRAQGGEFVLHGNKGDFTTLDSFEPYQLKLDPSSVNHFSPLPGTGKSSGGRKGWPYYNLQMPGGGVFLAIGWPGQWASSFARDAGQSLRIVAGQELTHLYLKPGEKIRTPLIAMVFWKGTNTMDAQNIWRRWMIAHNLPRTADGSLPPPQIAANTSHQFGEMVHANETNQNYFIDRYLAEGMKIDYWWMDAAWYPCGGQWIKTGTWEPDTNRFPNGLRGVSDHAHARGVKTIVWFEPERVGDPDSWLAKNHPEWLLHPGSVGLIFNEGNPSAFHWLTNHIEGLIKSQGIDFYREDMNGDGPCSSWRANDAPDRQGITENFYVQGHLAYWDALRAMNPNLRLDSCASGGRRDDLETMRRAVPLIRSDYLFEPTSQQCQQYGFAAWIPYSGAGYVVGHSAIGFNLPPEINRYVFRSEMTVALTLSYDMREKDLDYNLARLLYRQLRQVAPNYLGDFYPLTPYSLSNNVWMAWQYDRPKAGEGMVQAFRRPACEFVAARFKLHGLDAKAKYVVTNLDHPHGSKIMTGDELMSSGLSITINKQPGAAIITYKLKVR